MTASPISLPARLSAALDALGPTERKHMVRDALMLLILNIRPDTGECTLSRQQLADRIGCKPDNISQIMSTLCRMGVIRRDTEKVQKRRGISVVTYIANLDAIRHSLEETEALTFPGADATSAPARAPAVNMAAGPAQRREAVLTEGARW